MLATVSNLFGQGPVDRPMRATEVRGSDERAWGRPWHVPSNAPRTQREAMADLCRVAGVPQVAIAELPQALLAVLRPVSPMMRELPEVAYQLERPFVLDSTAAQRTFGLAPTSWDEVLAAQVAAYRR